MKSLNGIMMNWIMMNRIYVSGPVTGYDEYNKPAFDNVKEKLLKLRFDEVITPFDVSLTKDDKLWIDYMKEDIQALLTCNAICMLNGSSYSKGAMIEQNIAIGLGYDIIFEENL